MGPRLHLPGAADGAVAHRGSPRAAKGGGPREDGMWGARRDAPAMKAGPFAGEARSHKVEVPEGRGEGRSRVGPGPIGLWGKDVRGPGRGPLAGGASSHEARSHEGMGGGVSGFVGRL
jgi:hypothetical protein